MLFIFGDGAMRTTAFFSFGRKPGKPGKPEEAKKRHYLYHYKNDENQTVTIIYNINNNN